MPLAFRKTLRLSLIGEGPGLKNYQKLIDQYGLQEVVSLLPVKPHPELMLQIEESDLLIVPSLDLLEDKEGIPTVIVESMAKGTTVMCTKVGGLKGANYRWRTCVHTERCTSLYNLHKITKRF